MFNIARRHHLLHGGITCCTAASLAAWRCTVAGADAACSQRSEFHPILTTHSCGKRRVVDQSLRGGAELPISRGGGGGGGGALLLDDGAGTRHGVEDLHADVLEHVGVVLRECSAGGCAGRDGFDGCREVSGGLLADRDELCVHPVRDGEEVVDGLAQVPLGVEEELELRSLVVLFRDVDGSGGNEELHGAEAVKQRPM